MEITAQIPTMQVAKSKVIFFSLELDNVHLPPFHVIVQFAHTHTQMLPYKIYALMNDFDDICIYEWYERCQCNICT